ncbi:hypothetical protein PG991_010313 [Apiospora marii]|uniref:Aminoglycoside phosphotransferase domain-containing protein n=1 Tax=Apiospora marii TaxID=335849 RepID=A0ABR1RIJ4_9PEZI
MMQRFITTAALKANKPPHYGVATWRVDRWYKNCRFVIRSSTGSVFLCRTEYDRFRESPLAREQYTRHLDLLRRRSIRWDATDTGDACRWLSKPFEPLIAELAPSQLSRPKKKGRPTLSDYMFAPRFCCVLRGTEEKMQALRVDGNKAFEGSFEYGSFEHHHMGTSVKLGEAFLDSAEPHVKSYHPSDVELWYDRAGAEDVLIKPPGKVFVHDHQGRLVTCFFKPADQCPMATRAEIQLSVQVVVNMPRPPTGPRVSRLRGIVRNGRSVFGLLFDWIDVKGRLVPGKAPEKSAALRERWAAELTANVKALHDKALTWSDPSPSSVLIDRHDHAWMVNFPGMTLLGPGVRGRAG